MRYTSIGAVIVIVRSTYEPHPLGVLDVSLEDESIFGGQDMIIYTRRDRNYTICVFERGEIPKYTEPAGKQARTLNVER